MTLAVHSSNDFWPSRLLHIDLAFSKVVTSDKEGSFGIVAGKNIEQMVCIVERTVVEGQRNLTLVEAVRYAFAIVGNVANKRPRYIESGLPKGFRVCIAAVTESDLAPRTRAVVKPATAITTRRATTIIVT
jgi:hypothetical protein